MDSNIWRVLMSIGRIGTRAVVVGLGVLVARALIRQPACWYK
jgi:hypothetical protein